MSFQIGTTHGLALAPDGVRLVAVGPGIGVVFDRLTRDVVVQLEGPIGHAYDVDVDPLGQSVAVCFHGGHVHRYELETGALLTKYKGHAGVPRGVRKVKFSPDGRLLASVAEDSTLRIWDVQDGTQLHLFKARADVNTVAWGPGEGQVVFATDVGLHMVDVEARRGRSRDTGPIAEVQIADGVIYTAWDGAIRALDSELELLFELEQEDVSRLRVAPGLLYAASWRGRDVGVSRWDLDTRTRDVLLGSSASESAPAVWALALDAERELLYVGVSPSGAVTSGVLAMALDELRAR